MRNKLNSIYKKARKIAIDNQSKIVIMSDCHRGIGNRNDNFLENKYIYENALHHYEKKGFTYIELGDGDEMWEVRDYHKIIQEYADIFKILKKFYVNNRFIMLYGNHDICKKSKSLLKEVFYKIYDEKTQEVGPLFTNFIVREALVLDYFDREIFLIHGHQVDFLNSFLWRFSRFLVRHVWRILEYLGLKDPTGTIRNYSIAKRVEKKLNHWSNKNSKILIAGHTHRPIYPRVGGGLYFNDGACVHPDGITCLEIENGKLTLVKWFYQIKGGKLLVARKIIEGKKSIGSFFGAKK